MALFFNHFKKHGEFYAFGNQNSRNLHAENQDYLDKSVYWSN